RGADPNDVEVVYHSPEGDDSRAMQLVVETGRVTPEHLALMLVRKHDWHDYDGVKYLLEHGADPNYNRRWYPLLQAIRRDNHLAIIELLLDHRGDPAARRDGTSPIELAARRGRGDVLEAIERRGVAVDLRGADRLIAACARNQSAQVRAISEREAPLVKEVLAQGATLLAEFTGTWNTAG